MCEFHKASGPWPFSGYRWRTSEICYSRRKPWVNLHQLFLSLLNCFLLDTGNWFSFISVTLAGSCLKVLCSILWYWSYVLLLFGESLPLDWSQCQWCAVGMVFPLPFLYFAASYSLQLVKQFSVYIGIADIMGRKFGYVKIPYNHSKSWAGSISMFIFGLLVSIGYAWIYSLLQKSNKMIPYTLLHLMDIDVICILTM